MASAHEILAGLERFGIRLGLDHLRELATELAHPERATPALLVAGTNGKGSVAALLSAIAGAAGLRAGLYTSPHLESVEERIRIAGEPISEAELGHRLREVLAAAERIGQPAPTYFEAMTLAACLHFANHQADVSVLEVGMGGRLDATNLADARLAVITAIALDHQEYLGSTLSAIAREKAGILRSGASAVLSPQEPEALAALVEAAGASGAPVVEVASEVLGLEVGFRGLDGLELRLATQRATYDLRSRLAGRHQAWNIATAVVAAERFSEAGLGTIDADAIARGVAACRWPGRLEPIAIPGTATTVLLDAAHNPAGCAALAAFLAELDRPFTLLFGALADKDIAGMLPPLARLARRVVLTRPISPRAAEPAALAALVPEGTNLLLEPEIKPALAKALADEPALLVAAGSIFLIGTLRTLLHERAEPVHSL